MTLSLLACASPEDIGNTYDEGDLTDEYNKGYEAGTKAAEANLQAMIDAAMDAKLAEYATKQEVADAQSAAEQHANDQASAAQVAAEQHADAQASAAQTAAEQHADAQASAALSDAKLYADAQDTAWLTTADANSAAVAAGALASAQIYADGILVSANAFTTTAISPVQTQVDGVDARVADIEADYLTSATMRRISSDETWTVGGNGADYATIQDAVAALDGVRIDSTATVTIAVNPGIYTLTSVIEFDHADGSRVRIEGSPAYPSVVALSTTQDYALHVMPGATLGYLGGFTIDGGGIATAGIYSDAGAFVGLGAVVLDGFDVAGLYTTGGIIWADADEAVVSGWSSTSNSYLGVYSTKGGVVSVPYMTADSNDYGFVAQYGGDIYVPYGLASNNTTAMQAASGGGLYAMSALALDNYSGFVASYLGSVDVSGAEADGVNDFVSQYGGNMFADDSVSNTTGVGYYSTRGSYINLDTSCARNASQAYATSYNGVIFGSVSSGCKSTKSYSSHDTTEFIAGF